MAARDESPTASMHALRLAQDPTSIIVLINGRIDPRDAARLGEQLGQLLQATDVDLVICDLGGLVAPDATATYLDRGPGQDFSSRP